MPPEVNGLWVNESFHNYADYALSTAFHAGLDCLRQEGHARRCAIMCSEAVWWRCHRGLISDVFKLHGTRVLHIMGPASPPEHPYTSAAHVVDGHLDYSSDQHQLSLP